MPAIGTAPAIPTPEKSLPPPWTSAAPPPPAATAASLYSGFSLLQPSVAWSPSPPPLLIGTAPAVPSPKILICNVPLKPISDFNLSDDKIAAAFHNSSRKTLNYIPPSVQNGEVLVRPTIDMIREDQIAGTLLLSDISLESGLISIILMIFFTEMELGMVPRKLKHTEVPVWIKLRHLPVELWTTDGLTMVASVIGRPLYLDAITRACTRLEFARVCVMLNVNSKLPKHIVIMMPNEHGGKSACKVDVEYEWLPPKCTNCTSLGHATKDCPLTKPVKPAVSVYVRKNQIPTPDSRRGDPVAPPDPVIDHPVTSIDIESDEQLKHRRDKAIWNVRGLNMRIIRSPCETSSSNSGYTLSLYWKLGLCHQMFVGCKRVYYLDGRGLWIILVLGLTDLAVTVDLPWLVGGDFNAVLDMSVTGLISLPVQGERFSWHNCSTDGQSLWKRLDRMFVNDAWMERWPNHFLPALPTTCDWYTDVFNHAKTESPQTGVRLSKEKKGELAMNIKLASGFLEIAQKLLQVDRHNSLVLQLKNCCRRANKRIFQISDSDGLVQRDPTTISNVFVAYFQGLLGGDRRIGSSTFTFYARGLGIFSRRMKLVLLSALLLLMMLKLLCLTLRKTKHQGQMVFPQELKLFQLSFADDLLLFCKVDVQSVNLFRRGLDLFASLSGLHTNPQKSQLIISKAASGLRDTLLETLGFQEGHLPVRYLGLPLISARISIADCQPLLLKIDSRIKGWEGVQLSFAGRVQLIKSVLVSLEVYWAMAFFAEGDYQRDD
ncbi:hypothetical protein Sango_1160800 [Sesamum angolense]|uniref:CCHC-type domain-containing protein n=1 Tax=Sesamum angolense TaxID=2727404 RepID=A0AAE2BWP0_9LAMI|nr:hypothetical protein Sango_1160800 [Sesamum angolense]